MPTPRYLPEINRVPPTNKPDPASEDSITQEVVGVDGAGKYLVRGVVTPARGDLHAVAGDVVTVQWRGGRPFMILDLAFRKGPGHDVFVTGGGVVEQLFVTMNPKTGKVDVFFRNVDQTVGLDLDSLKPGIIPTAVQWGDDNRSFVVFNDTARHFFVFRLNRTAKKTFRPKQRVRATFVEEFDLSTIRDFLTVSVSAQSGNGGSIPYDPYIPLPDLTSNFGFAKAVAAPFVIGANTYRVYVKTSAPTTAFGGFGGVRIDNAGNVLLVLYIQAFVDFVGTLFPGSHLWTTYGGNGYVAIVNLSTREVLENKAITLAVDANVGETLHVRTLLDVRDGAVKRVLEMIEDETGFGNVTRFRIQASGDDIATQVLADKTFFAVGGIGFLDFNSNRAIWIVQDRDGGNNIIGYRFMMTDFIRQITAELDSTPATEPQQSEFLDRVNNKWAKAYKLLDTDFLYDFAEPTKKGARDGHFMLAAWNHATGEVLIEGEGADANFPGDARDKKMDPVSTLFDLPKGVTLPAVFFSIPGMSLQVVNDRSVLAPINRFFTQVGGIPLV